MIFSLVRKELRSLLPFIALILVLFAFEIADVLLTQHPDRHGIAHLVNSSHSDESIVAELFYFIIAFALGLGLLVRERDEGTLEFLDALPVTRNRLFFTKILCGIAVLSLIPLSGNALVILLQAWSRDSLEPGFHLREILRSLAVESAVMAAYLGIGAGLSFLRRFAWLALGLAFGFYLLLSSLDLPGVNLLNIFAVTNYAFDGQSLVIPWKQFEAALVLGACGYFAAWTLFQLQGDRLSHLWGRLERSPWKGPLLGAGLVFSVAVWIIVLSYLSWKHIEDDPSLAAGSGDPMQAIVYPSWTTSRAERGSFEFVYPSNLSHRAEAVMSRAEAAAAAVSAFLQTESPGRIVADLASNSRHAAATANWKRLNMDLTVSGDPDELTAILGHELVHVYIDSASDGFFSRTFDSSRWFHEGLASYLEHRLFRAPDQITRLRLIAAFAYERKQADLEKLVEGPVWRRDYDSNLVYPLGEVFLHALVTRYGDEAPGNLLRAAVRPDRPPGLSGLDLWRDLFLACDYDFSAVAALYYASLKQLREENAGFIDSLPEIHARVYVEGPWIMVEPRIDGNLPDGARMIGRFRASTEDADALYESVPLEPGSNYAASRLDYPGAAVWLQLGIAVPECSLPLFEEWESYRLR